MTDLKILETRLDLFEHDGWKDVVEELKNISDSINDVDGIRNEQGLWEAKGKLQVLNYIINLENVTRTTMEQLETAP